MSRSIDQPALNIAYACRRILIVSCVLLSNMSGVWAVDWGPYPGIRAEQTFADRQRQGRVPILGIEEIEKTSGWIIQPEISVDETLTDNLRLAPDGLEESDLITTVTPGLRISRLSRRLDFSLYYNLQNLFYKNNSDLNDRFNLLDINGTGEILEDRFFLDVSVKNSQQNVNRAGSVALDNISQSDDRSNVLSYSVSPYWIQRVGDFMDVEARYEMNEIRSSDAFDSESENITLTAVSGSDFSRILWGITYDDEEIDNEGGTSTTKFRTLFANLEYILTRKFALKGSVGYDDNEFTSSDTDISGPRWNLGAVWRPSLRTHLEATAGRRFFGTDLYLEASHRSRRTRWLFTFSQEPDTTRSTLFNQQVFTDTDIFGQPIDPETGEQALLNITEAAQTAEVLIRKRFNASVNYTLRKNIFDLTLFHETREFQVSDSEDTSKGLNISWRWLIGSRTSSILRFSWSDSEFRAGESSEFFITEYTLTRSLGKTLEANIGFRNVERVSESATREFTENRIFASIHKTF